LIRSYTKLKEVDDVLGGSAAWENVDSTEEACPKCSHARAYFMQIQVLLLCQVWLVHEYFSVALVYRHHYF
jgi:hypothetical protein